MTTQTERRSIYAHVRPTPDSPTPAARKARRHRARARLETPRTDAPPIRADRIRPIEAILRAYRLQGTAPGSPITGFLASLEAEVVMLEAWSEGRTKAEQRAGPTIRRALELLRAFGRITVLDFSEIPDDERTQLVALLALEHRWCYAAAGTTRDAFKVAIGRTGAR